jgi:aspartate/methionine/tyrosine aminotransferase
VDLPPFLLNDWLERHGDVSFNLAGSCGPSWTVGELLDLGDETPDLDAIAIDYCPVDGLAELRAEIAGLYGVDPAAVLVTHGASEGLLLLALASARPGGNVMLPMPAYSAFAGVCQVAGLATRSYPQPQKPLTQADITALVAQTNGDTVLMIINTPHSPTGATLNMDDCCALARALSTRGVLLAIDTVYDPLQFGDFARAPTGCRDTIILGSMSKLLSLPGLRLGWIVDTDEIRRAKLTRARGYSTLGGSPILETLALHALRNREAILKRLCSVAAANLGALNEFMALVGDILEWSPPRGGMLAFPRFRDGRDSRGFCERLAELGVLVAPGDCFGMPAHMRIGFGSQRTGIGVALAIMGQALRAAPTDAPRQS